jgi:hypothetical protein
MTLKEAIDVTAKRTGLRETNTTFSNQARVYLSIVAKRINTRAKWWWQAKTTTFTTTKTLTVSGITSGPFVAGDVVTGAGLGSATIDSSYDATNADTTLLIISENSTAFVADEALTSSGTAIATVVAAASPTQTYQLASDVVSPHSFIDNSNNQVLFIVPWDSLDQVDPDRSETGDVDIVTIEGMDASTGKVVIRMFPIHDTTGDVIRYRYLSFIPDWTSADDSTALDRWLPQVLQQGLIFGATELFKQEKGDTEGALIEKFEFETTMKGALEQNINIWGNREYHRGDSSPFFNFFPQEGGLSAAS